MKIKAKIIKFRIGDGLQYELTETALRQYYAGNSIEWREVKVSAIRWLFRSKPDIWRHVVGVYQDGAPSGPFSARMDAYGLRIGCVQFNPRQAARIKKWAFGK